MLPEQLFYQFSICSLRTFPDDWQDYGEDRWIGFGLLGNHVIAVAFTEPEEDTIRIISMRRALTHEKKQYEQYIRENYAD